MTGWSIALDGSRIADGSADGTSAPTRSGVEGRSSRTGDAAAIQCSYRGTEQSNITGDPMHGARWVRLAAAAAARRERQSASEQCHAWLLLAAGALVTIKTHCSTSSHCSVLHTVVQLSWCGTSPQPAGGGQQWHGTCLPVQLAQARSDSYYISAACMSSHNGSAGCWHAHPRRLPAVRAGQHAMGTEWLHGVQPAGEQRR